MQEISTEKRTEQRTWGNRVLDRLPVASQHALLPVAAKLALARGAVTTRAGEPLQHVDFPIDAIVAVIARTPSGKSIETAVVGNEGFVETDGPLYAEIAQRSAVVRSPGSVWRLPLAAFRAGLESDAHFLQSVRSALRTRIFLTEQAVLCNAHHTMDQRLARWLLDAHDRSGTGHLKVTQAELAAVLGVRRAGISLTVARFRRAGAVTNERGGVVVTDSEKLQAEACECYDAMREARTGMLE